MPKRKEADMKEIAAFWTSVMRNEEATATERFKASELLSKYHTGDDNADEQVFAWFKQEDGKKP